MTSTIHPDADRCLLCRNPQCRRHCPVATDIPGLMRLYREGQMEQAGNLLFQNNPMSAICSHICDWQKQCFGHCVLNAQNDPIHWYQIEQEISEAYLKEARFTLPVFSGHRATVAGAGPAGLTAAIILARHGVRVTLLDSHEKPGGVLRYGIPAFRLERSLVEAYEQILLDLGVQFEGNVQIGRQITVAQLAASSEAVLIATGASRSRQLGIPGEESPGVHQALAFLADPRLTRPGSRVIVIGGGNVAMDAARTALRLGAEVQICYRKTYANMPANPLEVKAAMDEGVGFSMFLAPVAVRRDSVVFCRCENELDARGRTVTRILKGTDTERPCDDLIIAAGEEADLTIFGGLEPARDERGHLVTDASGLTSLSGIYVAGDMLLGPSTVADAAATAKRAAVAMLQEMGVS